MMNELTRLATKPLTRRRFLEGMGAAGAAAALASCGDAGKGVGTLFEDTSGRPAVPAITGTVVAGNAGHNCGGKCVTKAYVENGVIKRFVTDERPDRNLVDGSGDDPQRRACVRCRAHKGFMYRADRLTRPLKQTRTRGDVDGFAEISWEQAFTEIAAKLQEVKSRHGAAALYNHYAWGCGASVPQALQCGERLLNCLGGQMTYRGDYSYPSIYQVSQFVVGSSSASANSRQDVTNAELFVIWALNHAESIRSTGSMWYSTQAKEKGVKVAVVDSRVSMTMATIADEQILPVPGTDPALVLGMMYHLLAEPTLAGGAAGSLLDPVFIRKYVHGFYDDPAPTHYRDTSPVTYVVPNGASLSAFVLGNERTLIDQGQNGGTSIYPESIGYNYTEGPLASARVPIWGQTPKTPEWAEKICGVPAATIRSFAEELATRRTTIWMGSGIQRDTEAEQTFWLVYVLAAITKNFGESGRSFGFPTDKSSAGSLGWSSVPNPVPASLASTLYDARKLTSARNTSSWARNNWPVFVWLDVAKNGGTGKSDWNDGQVKRMPVGIKALLNFGGNCLVNQTGHAEYSKAILRDRSKIELIVSTNLYMTASAAMSDYVLPAAAQYEKVGGVSTTEGLLYMGKAVEPLGESRSDYDIGAGIAEKLGLKEKYTEGRTDEDWVRSGWERNRITAMTYEEWKQAGIYSVASDAKPQVIRMKAFRDDPTRGFFSTPSGKLEAFSQGMVEDYCARGYGNLDPSDRPEHQLQNGAALFDPEAYSDTDKSPRSTRGRFVYPIPMYIPLAEGRHADERPSIGDVTRADTGGIPHPDPLGLRAQGLDCILQTWHMAYRSHSTHNGNAFMNELYKKDAKGRPAFNDPRTRTSLATWDDGVYEPVWVNPETARARGIAHGDRGLVSNGRGKMYVSVEVTQRARPGVVYIGQGSWHQLNAAGIDVGGCANTLTSARPSRIGQGMTLGGGTLVKIEKA